MHYYEVAPTKIVRAGSDSFTYSCGSPLSIGQIVSIEVGKKQLHGVIVSKSKKPSYATKPISSVVNDTPLPDQLVSLANWMKTYYSTPLANVLQTMLPRGLGKTRRAVQKNHDTAKRDRTNIVFTAEQSAALKQISQYDDGSFMIRGVTGSGKTEIYIEIAKQQINAGRSVIILIPEISLTSQVVAQFSNHFSNLVVTHSNMTESLRHQTWDRALNSNQPLIVIGPRSAIFTPLKNVGAIIVDECHEPSYKQEQSPKYSALRLATMLGRFHKAKVLFGSATPSVSDTYLAKMSDRPIIQLTKPARSDSKPPKVTVVDMTNRTKFGSHRFLSKQLLEQIAETLKQSKQTLIFHNRRGSANTTLCENCGWTSECSRCFIPMTLHSDNHRLVCHICGTTDNVPTECPKCRSVDIVHKGIGTKVIESELKKLFPKANISRFDGDSDNSQTVDALYKDLYDGTVDIIIGTQIVAKGLDLPNLRTVGIIQADAGLAIPDYTTKERVFQLLAQVVGRVGRDKHDSQVIVQTYQPGHPSIADGITQNYDAFYAATLTEREQSLFPPYRHLLKLTVSYITEASTIKNAKKVADIIRSKSDKNIRILGPTPAFYERMRGKHHWQIVIKSPKREHLLEVIKLLPTANWQFELDPTSLL